MASNTHGQSSPGGTPAKGGGKYQWGKGGKTHSIPLATHQQNLAAVNALGGRSLTAPPDASQAYREANAAADAQFGPQVAAAQQLNANVAPWFRDYMARVAGYAQSATKLSQPVLDQAGAYQQGAAAQSPPGLDPNSQAGQQAAQAASGRQALAQLGLDALNTNAQSTQDYFGGLQGIASRELPQAQTAAAQALANAQSQRGAAVTDFLTKARQDAQNYQIARGTLGLNTEKAAADVASTTATATERARHNRASERNTAASRIAAARAKGETVNKYGYTDAEWQRHSVGFRQHTIQNFEDAKGKGSTDAAAQKHANAITKATGVAKVKVQDIMDAWARGGTMPAPTSQDKNATRKMTREELRSALGAKYGGTWVGIMERVRAHQPLTTDQIDYLHSTNPDLRIPREWLPQSQGGAKGPGGNAPAGAVGGHGESRPT